jgi:hypothetical protein
MSFLEVLRRWLWDCTDEAKSSEYWSSISSPIDCDSCNGLSASGLKAEGAGAAWFAVGFWSLCFREWDLSVTTLWLWNDWE